ncbi:hypothetical protein MPK71_gp310 [Erwinia phage pEa_SNUABM_1]|uniref:Uncharacterized protein n=1 Tax=Erwinia phage pEa_SNUABM_1 TaxID=2869543 RepID=A0AAE8BZN5_9CAUD|nr:hypothetical protein MPK71_gp310 [Erwinia phage pEa_SNUABM_1]QZE57519.1 hypothetical protein pEaSNUABM1_00310 [Erwinia phage pEa_SNUABM_1]
MSFDMRQNVLMVRSLIKGQPFYYFYNAEGLEFSLSGYQLKEIYDCHFEGRMAAITTYWGFSNKPNYESFEFAENGDLLWHVSLNATCSTLLPLEMINGHEGFNVINGFMIDDHKRTVMKIHQKAVGRSVERLTWFRDMSEERMRELLTALGHGPMRIERADREELIKIHRDWQRKHDEDFKYTHNACGVDPDDKLPADLYDDHGKWLRQRHMAKGKTLEMMASELANLVRIFDLYDGENDDFDHMNPDWDEGLRRVAQAFIYGPNAKERFDAVKYDSQFVVNGIYALAKDMNWIHVNEESQDYQESLIRRLMQELKNEIERPDGVFVVEDGIVMLKAASATAIDTDVVDEVEEDEDEPEKERGPRKFPVVLRHDRIKYDYVHRALVKMGVVKKNKTRQQLGKAQKLTVAQQEAALLATLRAVVFDPDQDVLSKLDETTLYQLAACMTKMKDGDRYPRDAEYLKELIKHALR